MSGQRFQFDRVCTSSSLTLRTYLSLSFSVSVSPSLSLSLSSLPYLHGTLGTQLGRGWDVVHRSVGYVLESPTYVKYLST